MSKIITTDSFPTYKIFSEIGYYNNTPKVYYWEIIQTPKNTIICRFMYFGYGNSIEVDNTENIFNSVIKWIKNEIQLLIKQLTELKGDNE